MARSFLRFSWLRSTAELVVDSPEGWPDVLRTAAFHQGQIRRFLLTAAITTCLVLVMRSLENEISGSFWSFRLEREMITNWITVLADYHPELSSSFSDRWLDLVWYPCPYHELLVVIGRWCFKDVYVFFFQIINVFILSWEICCIFQLSLEIYKEQTP